MKTKKAIRAMVLSAVAVFGIRAFAETLYVDCNDPNATYRTIQAAIGAAKDNDVILVAPGDYCNDVIAYGADGARARVVVNRNLSNLVIEAEDPDPSKTRIVGAYDDGSANKVGPNAVMCMIVTATVPVTIKGFTFLNGAACSTGSDTVAASCGGLYVAPGNSNMKVCAVNCVFKGCVGTRGGAMRNGNAIRCTFEENDMTISDAGVLYNVTCANCLIRDNVWRSTGGPYLLASGTFYNCTFVDNSFYYLAPPKSAKFYNCVVLGCSQLKAQTVYSSVFGSQGGYSDDLIKGDDDCVSGGDTGMFFAPGFGDVAILNDTLPVNRGKISYLQNYADQLANYSVTADVFVDRDGRKIAADEDGQIAAGCSQTVKTPAGGPIVIAVEKDGVAAKDVAITVDGRPFAAGSSFHDESYPVQHVVKVVEPGYRAIYLNALNVISANNQFRRYPEMDGSMHVMGSPVAAETVTHTIGVTANILYVNPDESIGSDTDGDGSVDKPYETALKAAEMAPNYCFIACAAGDYAKGEYTYGTNDKGRLYDYRKNLLFHGEGADKCRLYGQSDKTNPGDGRGPNALRCARFYNKTSAIQGFTVTGGRTQTTDGTLYTGCGGAGIYANFVDCTITNCAAGRGQVAYNGLVARCIVIGNTVANTKGDRLFENNCCVYSSLILLQNPEGGSVAAQAADCPLYHCTLYPSDTSGAYHSTIIGAGGKYYNCAAKASGAYSTSWAIEDFGSVWKWDTQPTATQVLHDHLDADPGFGSWTGYDCRLWPDSPAIGTGYMPDDYYKWYCSDLNGRPVVFRNGRPLQGAVQAFMPKGFVLFLR